MRLNNNKEIEIIKNEINKFFPNSEAYIFGSRLDEKKAGGDVDIFIKIKKFDKEAFKKKLKLQIILEDKLFLPVDIVLSKSQTTQIEKEAKKGFRIC